MEEFKGDGSVKFEYKDESPFNEYLNEIKENNYLKFTILSKKNNPMSPNKKLVPIQQLTFKIYDAMR